MHTYLLRLNGCKVKQIIFNFKKYSILLFVTYENNK